MILVSSTEKRGSMTQSSSNTLSKNAAGGSVFRGNTFSPATSECIEVYSNSCLVGKTRRVQGSPEQERIAQNMVGGTSSHALRQVSSGSVPISHPAPILSTIRLSTSDEGGSLSQSSQSALSQNASAGSVLHHRPQCAYLLTCNFRVYWSVLKPEFIRRNRTKEFQKHGMWLKDALISRTVHGWLWIRW